MKNIQTIGYLMYIKHPVFETPENKNIKIWRYQSLSKLISNLLEGSLFFSRADRLEDKYEGSLPKLNIRERRSALRFIEESGPQIATAFKENMGRELNKDQANKLAKKSALYIECYQRRENMAYRRFTCINCWHMNENESAAMWKLYCQTNEAVAIQSTFSRLIKSLEKSPEEVYIGMVKYTDYDTAAIPVGNDFYRFLYKRHSFNHEREIRAIYQQHPPLKLRKDGTQKVDWDAKLFESGMNIHADIDTLIERIVVSPTAPGWFFHVVESVVIKYGFKIPVQPSSLSIKPQF